MKKGTKNLVMVGGMALLGLGIWWMINKQGVGQPYRYNPYTY